MATQWHESGGMESHRTGLHYGCVESALRMHGVPIEQHGARFEELRAMEQGALAAWANRRRAASSGRR